MNIIDDIKVVLASASPRRRALLEQIGIKPHVIPSEVDEIITTLIPEQAVIELSTQKAEDVSNRCGNNTLIIGADTIVAANGRILGKPKSREEAAHMIGMLQGNTHQVYTGVTLILKTDSKEVRVTFSEKTDVTVYPMDSNEISAYAESPEPMDKAGAYGIQGSFAAYIRKITGDYNNVVGLPTGRIYQEIKRLKQQEVPHD